MKRIFSTVLFLCWILALTAALCACSENAEKNVPAGYYDIFKPDGKGGIFIGGAKGSLVAQATYPGVTDQYFEAQLKYPGLLTDMYLAIHYPSGIHPTADMALRKLALNEADNLMNRTTEINQDGPVETSKKNYPALTTYSLFQTERAISVAFTHWSYMGGAHGLSSYDVLSFDRASGRPLNVKDIFPDAGSIDKVAQWLSARPEQWSNTHNQAWGTPPALEAREITMSRVILEPEGLCLLFGPYVKGPYSMGEVRARVPLAAFGELGLIKAWWEPAAGAK